MSIVPNIENIESDVVITLKEILDVLNAERAKNNESDLIHAKQMVKVDELAKVPSFGTVAKMESVYNDKGQTIKTYGFTRKQALAVGARLDNKRLMFIIDKLEEKSKPKTQLELAREQVALLERLEQVEQEKQYAIKTKAWISDKKTATAMNTASTLSKENEKLKQKADESKKYSTIRKQEKIHSCKFAWRPLRKYCLENGLTIKDVPDDLYEFVKSYPAVAWIEVYGVDITS